MEYSINKFSKLAGISTRTLRYYDQIGLLCPDRVSSNGYRIYGKNEIDTLQQILFYRELGMELEEIKKILLSEKFDSNAALEAHLSALLQKQARLSEVINNVRKTILTKKGKFTMNDHEKFEGFKQKMIEENEKNHGEEIRKKYGDEPMNAANAKLKGLTEAQYTEAECLRKEIDKVLLDAFHESDPGGEKAQKVCDLHKKWLCHYYPMYSNEYHKGLGEMYVSDERFKAYYDGISPGCAEFLRDAINIYCETNQE